MASVEPVSGCAAVLVTVLSREVEIVEINAIQRSLTEASGVLRSAVASGTHRKRVPTLRFRVLPDVS